jgi:hypothetical protein
MSSLIEEESADASQGLKGGAMAARTPHEFRDTAEVVTALRQHAPAIEAWFGPQPTPLQELLRTAVHYNTWRSFQLMPAKPSVIGRAWIMAQFLSPDRQRVIRDLQSQEDYDAWHARRCRSLARHWQQSMQREIPVGPGCKIVDLVMKAFVRWAALSTSERDRLIGLLHVPLDRYALVGIRQCLPQFRIRASATMGSIQDWQAYRALQTEIRRITEQAQMPPIYYDWLAWNERHQTVV